MSRYLALVWDLADPDAAGSAAVMLTTIMKSSARWHVAFEGPGIAVVYPREHNRIDRPYVFARNRGVVFGKLFWRDSKTESTTHVEKLDEHITDRALATRGRYIVDAFWGRYVCFLVFT